MDYRHEDQQKRQRLLTIVDRGTPDQLFVSIDFTKTKFDSFFFQDVFTRISSKSF